MNTPDRWVILKLNSEGKALYKVLAGWSGSYLDGQSWKINSGITKVESDEDCYLFHGYSGSVYKCHKTGYGMNSIMMQVLSRYPNVEVLEDQDFSKLEGL
jgi:hypothetical protein